MAKHRKTYPDDITKVLKKVLSAYGYEHNAPIELAQNSSYRIYTKNNNNIAILDAATFNTHSNCRLAPVELYQQFLEHENNQKFEKIFIPIGEHSSVPLLKRFFFKHWILAEIDLTGEKPKYIIHDSKPYQLWPFRSLRSLLGKKWQIKHEKRQTIFNTTDCGAHLVNMALAALNEPEIKIDDFYRLTDNDTVIKKTNSTATHNVNEQDSHLSGDSQHNPLNEGDIKHL